MFWTEETILCKLYLQEIGNEINSFTISIDSGQKQV